MDKVINLLKENKVMSLATSHNDKPRVSILEYYLIDNHILFTTSPDSIKAVNMKHNNRVSISVNSLPVFATLDGYVSQPTADEVEKYKSLLFQNHPEFKEMITEGKMAFTYFKFNLETAYYNDYSKGMTPTAVIKA